MDGVSVRSSTSFAVSSGSISPTKAMLSVARLNGNIEATQRVLQQTSEVLGLTYEQPSVGDVAPAPKAQPNRQPQVEVEAVTDPV